MTCRVLAAAGLLVGFTPISARGDGYTCSFSRGVGANLRGATWDAYEALSEASPLMFEFQAYSRTELTKMLARAKQKKDQAAVKALTDLVEMATAMGGAGLLVGADGVPESVVVVRGMWTVTFIETTGVGNAMTTSVFLSEKTLDGKFPAVHSRHTSIPGGAVTSQYSGACTSKK